MTQWRNDAVDDGRPDTTDDHDGSVYEYPEPAEPAEPEQPAATTTTSPSGQVDKVP